MKSRMVRQFLRPLSDCTPEQREAAKQHGLVFQRCGKRVVAVTSIERGDGQPPIELIAGEVTELPVETPAAASDVRGENAPAHTPGPSPATETARLNTRNWRVEAKHIDAKATLWRVLMDYEAEGRWYTAVAHEGYDEYVARLIAAAPALAEACRVALARVEATIGHLRAALARLNNS